MRAVAALMTTAMRWIGRDTDAFTLALKNGFVFIDWDRAPLTPVDGICRAAGFVESGEAEQGENAGHSEGGGTVEGGLGSLFAGTASARAACLCAPGQVSPSNTALASVTLRPVKHKT